MYVTVSRHSIDTNLVTTIAMYSTSDGVGVANNTELVIIGKNKRMESFGFNNLHGRLYPGPPLTFKYVATRCSFRRLVSSSMAARCCRYRSFSSSLIRDNLLPFLFFLGAIFAAKCYWKMNKRPTDLSGFRSFLSRCALCIPQSIKPKNAFVTVANAYQTWPWSANGSRKKTALFQTKRTGPNLTIIFLTPPGSWKNLLLPES